MFKDTKKIFIISGYYLVVLSSFTGAAIFIKPFQEVVNTIFMFLPIFVVFAVFSDFYLFRIRDVDIHHKKGTIQPPLGRDITKRKVLFITFIYTVFFIFMVLYPSISFLAYAGWPIMIFLSILLLVDRRIIFVPYKDRDEDKNTVCLQKYGIRFLMLLTAFSLMWLLYDFITTKSKSMLPLFSDGWDRANVYIWIFPIILVSALVLADWVTTCIKHEGRKNFFKRTDIVLFVGIQVLITLFLIMV